MANYVGPSSTSYMPNVAAQADETFTRTIQERLKHISGAISDTHGDLIMLHERMFGAQPAGQGPNGSAPSLPVVAGEIMSQLDSLQQLAVRVASQARDLNSRV